MLIDKNITIDLNRRFQSLPIINLHQGDDGGAQIVITVLKDGEPFALTGITAKYKATLAGFLAIEEEQTATVSGNTITVPVSDEMTATGGLLRIEISLTDTNSNLLYTQNIRAYVEESIITPDTTVDVQTSTIAALINSKYPAANVQAAQGNMTPTAGFADYIGPLIKSARYSLLRIENLYFYDIIIIFHQGEPLGDYKSYYTFQSLPVSTTGKTLCGISAQRVTRRNFTANIPGYATTTKTVGVALQGSWVNIYFPSAEKTFAEDEAIVIRAVLYANS